MGRRLLLPFVTATALATVVTLVGTGTAAQARPLGATVSPTARAEQPARYAGAPRVVWDTCRSSVPDRARCGHIRVLADPARPGLGHQRVGFELYPHRNRAKPSLETIVANEGGPGYPSTGSRGYYLGLFRPMMKRHDLLLVDVRGTGMSQALLCEPLQRNSMPYVEAVTACGKQLGRRADTYSTAFAANDLASVLDALKIPVIDLYGDSYGTFFSQVFTLYHPARVRTLVLDASYPVSGNDVWWRDTNRAIIDALTHVCERDPACASLPGDAVARMRSAAEQLAKHPIEGRAPDADGKVIHVRVDDRKLALVAAYATYGTNIYRELDSALRALRAGYERPLLRLVAENITLFGGNGPVRAYSAAEYVAVICADYPQLWDVATPPGKQREKQYRAAVAAVRANDPDGFDPFSVSTWLSTRWTEPRTCIGWPSPSRHALPPSPAGLASYPTVPTLVLSGDLDSVTSPEGGEDVAGRFPNATFVSVSNVGHVTAMGDKQGCAAGIVRRFVSSGGTVSGTGCATKAYPTVRVVPRFARTSDHLVPAAQGATVRSSLADRRVVAGAAWAAGDVITRWFINYSAAGSGLQGGHYSYTGGHTVTFRLRDYRFVKDVAVSGSVVWDRTTGEVGATLDVAGPGGRDGTLRLAWEDWDQHAQATVRGQLGGRDVRLVTGAP